MHAWIAVAIGGALGSVARHGVNRIVHQEWPLLRFPLATVIVNIVGCGVIGVLAGLVATGRLPMRTNWREFIFVGILGGSSITATGTAAHSPRSRCSASIRSPWFAPVTVHRHS